MPDLAAAYDLMHQGTLALSEVERNGIGIDVEYCKEKTAWLDTKIAQSERRLKSTILYKTWHARYGEKISYGSPHQLRAVLYDDLKVPPSKQTETGEDGTDEEALRSCGVEGIEHLIRMRKCKKMQDNLKNFLQLQINGRMYPTFHLHTVATYRSSSSDPNSQNLQKRDKEAMEIVRRACVPMDGHQILEIDYSGIEVAVAACYHKDPTMLEYLTNPKSDMHTDTGRDLFLMQGVNRNLKELEGWSSTFRQASKNGFVFPQFYGDYFVTCALNIACNWLKLPQDKKWKDTDGMPLDGAPIGAHLRSKGINSLDDYTEHVKKVEDRFWNKKFPVYKKWREDWYEDYCNTGGFDMYTGFHVGGSFRKNQVVNYPVQGAAFHILLWTLIQVVGRIKGWRSKVIGEIHDSILIDAHPEEIPELVSMVNYIASTEVEKHWPWIIVPMRVEAMVSEINGSWAHMRVIG